MTQERRRDNHYALITTHLVACAAADPEPAAAPAAAGSSDVSADADAPSASEASDMAHDAKPTLAFARSCYICKSRCVAAASARARAPPQQCEPFRAGGHACIQ
jgi:hypothetical protein